MYNKGQRSVDTALIWVGTGFGQPLFLSLLMQSSIHAPRRTGLPTSYTLHHDNTTARQNISTKASKTHYHKKKTKTANFMAVFESGNQQNTTKGHIVTSFYMRAPA